MGLILTKKNLVQTHKLNRIEIVCENSCNYFRQIRSACMQPGLQLIQLFCLLQNLLNHDVSLNVYSVVTIILFTYLPSICKLMHVQVVCLTLENMVLQIIKVRISVHISLQNIVCQIQYERRPRSSIMRSTTARHVTRDIHNDESE